MLDNHEWAHVDIVKYLAQLSAAQAAAAAAAAAAGGRDKEAAAAAGSVRQLAQKIRSAQQRFLLSGAGLRSIIKQDSLVEMQRVVKETRSDADGVDRKQQVEAASWALRLLREDAWTARALEAFAQGTKPRPELLAGIVQAARAAGHSLPPPAAAGGSSLSAQQAACAATAAEAAALAADRTTKPQPLRLLRLLLTHYEQASLLARNWCREAAALAEQLKALARGQGLASEPLAVAPGAAAGAPAVAYVTIPQVAAAVSTARAHLELAPLLPVQVDAEVEVLAEASKAYCLCQALYDDIRPMIGCDYCSDWFHWECVGLQPPREDQDHTEVAPPDFK